MKFLVNPFITYFVAFLLALFFYSLGWSSIYPTLSIELTIFIIISSVICLAFAISICKYKKIEFKKVENSKIGLYTLISVSLYCLEFIYNKGIPILMVYNKQKYDYIQFGIPTLHVIIMTFGSFLTLFTFHLYLSKPKKLYLIYFIINLILPILVINRGMFIMNLTSCFSIFLIYKSNIKLKHYTFIIILVLILFYFFGVLGNLRTNNGRNFSNDEFLKISGAKKEFVNSSIPKEFMWSYYYISSPLANLQFAINKSHGEYHPDNFLMYEFLPNFITKRFENITNIKPIKPDLIMPSCVGSVYIGSFTYMKWLGLFFMCIFIVSSTGIFLFILKPNNDFYITFIAIVNTIIIFNTFANMYTFTGLSFELVYPILFGLFQKYNIVIKKTNLE